MAPRQAVVEAPQRTLSSCRATLVRLGTDHACRLIRYRSAPSRTARRHGVSAPHGTRMAHMCHGRGSRRSSPNAFTQVDPPVLQTGLPMIVVPPREFET
jgi:hypothetical protein